MWKKIISSIVIMLFVGVLIWGIVWISTNWEKINSQTNLYTQEEYLEYGEERYNAGVETAGETQVLVNAYGAKIVVLEEQIKQSTIELEEMKKQRDDSQAETETERQLRIAKEKEIETLNELVQTLRNEITRLTQLLESYEDIAQGTCELDFYVGEQLYMVKAVRFNCTLNETISAEKEGYAFKGWSLDKINVVDINSMTFTQNTEFYAVLEKDAGLFNAETGALLKTWAQLLADGDVEVDITDEHCLSWVEYDVAGELYIPSTITRIRQGFSKRNGITFVKVPDSVVEIANGAFSENVGLKSVQIGAQIIGERAFLRCSSLTSVEFSNNLISIGNEAFSDCKLLDNVKLPNSLIDLGESAFAYCNNLQSIILSEELTELKDSTFMSTDLREIYIPAKISSILANTFSYCRNLAFISVDENNSVFDSRQNCNAVVRTENGCMILGGVNTTFVSGITEIGSSAFAGRNITSIILPESITIIGKNAFADCDLLVSIKLSSQTNVLAERAFAGCDKLATIYIPSTVNIIEGHVFNYTPITVYCAVDSKQSGWDNNCFYGINVIINVKYGYTYEQYLAEIN